MLTYFRNLIYRACNRIDPAHIKTAGLTHLLFAFASFDPTSFQVTSVQANDAVLYSQFTHLKTTIMQTWIAIGGGDFTDSTSSTYHAWSDMTSTAARRAIFIASLEDFMVKYGFQGVDLGKDTCLRQRPVNSNMKQIGNTLQSLVGVAMQLTLPIS